MIRNNLPVWVVIVYLVFSCLPVCSQTHIDSLLSKLENTDVRLDRIELYLTLSAKEEDLKQSLVYALAAHDLLEGNDELLLKGRVYQMLGRGYVNHLQEDSASQYLQHSLEIFDSLGLTRYKAKSLYYYAFLSEKVYLPDTAVHYYTSHKPF